MTKVEIPKTGEATITITVPVDALREMYEKAGKLKHPKILLQKDFVRQAIGRAVENLRTVVHSLDNEKHPAIEYRVED